MSVQDDRRPVTVGVDGSEEASRAVRWAAVEAARRRAPLRLVGASDGLPPKGMATHLDRARAVAERTAPGIDVESEVADGSPDELLGAEAAAAQLLALGAHGRGRWGGCAAGTVAVALAAHAPCPVVVVRGVERDPAQEARLPVVLGVAGRAGGAAAITFAFEAAAARGVALLAVHAWRAPAGGRVTGLRVGRTATRTQQRDLRDRRLAQVLEDWSHRHPEVPVRRVLTRGRPASCLVERSAGAQLIVVGSRGHGELAGLLLGSVSNAVLHRSRCPVAVVRA